MTGVGMGALDGFNACVSASFACPVMRIMAVLLPAAVPGCNRRDMQAAAK